MKIVSLLPSATEIVASLGLLDQLVGVSHECDFPASVNALPRVLHCPIYNVGLSSAEIDRRVRESIANGGSLYEIDVPLLTQLEPDLVLTQMLCDVCAIGYGTVAGLIATLPKRPELLNLSPKCLDDLYVNVREVAAATGTQMRGEMVVQGLQSRVEKVVSRVKDIRHKPRVLFLEWIDPLFGAGHWTPELIELAGGVCAVGKTGVPSVTLDWSTAVESEPDVVVVAYDIERIKEDIPILTSLPGWSELPAARTGEVYLIDGSQFFNRSGPRLVDSLEMLAAALHPECFERSAVTENVLRLKDIELTAV